MNTERIGKTTAFFMIVFALLVDGIDFLLGGGLFSIIIDIPAAIIFGIWFSHHDVSVMSSKRVGAFLGTIVAEAIPGISDAPVWTFFVGYTIWKERARSATV